MNIITVIPLSRSKIAAELFYFTSSVVPVGAIVSVPLRSKSIFAIVTKSEPGEDLKTDLKRAPFEIRKLDKIKANVFFPVSFIEACRELSEYYATTIGAVIEATVSGQIIDNIHKITPPLPSQASFGITEAAEQRKFSKGTSGVYAVQGDDNDRISSTKSLIRQEFALKKSVVIYTPTIEDCEKTFEAIEKGIEGYIFKLNSGQSEKKILEIWKNIAETEHPIVVVATASFPLLPRGDIRSVVIEKENGRGWISPRMPYMDMRQVIATIAKRNKQNIYLADSLLRLETLFAKENEEIEEGSPFKWRSVSTARDILIDMRLNKQVTLPEIPPTIAEESVDRTIEGTDANISSVIDCESTGAGDFTSNNSQSESDIRVSVSKPPPSSQSTKRFPKFKVLSPELEDLIRANSEENTHLFIFAVRRGLSPSTVCDDCGNIVMCKQCKATVVLHTSPETGRNYFMCHVCGERRSADEHCLVCDSWRLTPLGIGIDRVHDEIKATFPHIDVFKIDSDSIKTEKKIRETLEKFKARPGSILLGTELAMQHFNERVEHVAVVSLDSLFGLPDFRIQEKIMYTLVRLRAQATRSILVQTRRIEQKVFEFGLKGNLSDFYRMIVDERKQFAYPPYSILIKITIEGKKDAIAKNMGEVADFLAPTEIDIFPAFTSTVRGKSVIHGLIKVPTHVWPDQDLITKLRSLPPNVMVKVGPESLL